MPAGGWDVIPRHCLYAQVLTEERRRGAVSILFPLLYSCLLVDTIQYHVFVWPVLVHMELGANLPIDP